MNPRNITRALQFAACMLLCTPGTVAASGPEPTFRIGDPAPALEPMAWIKGGPVDAFEPGHVYVVKFFATWCGACNAAMPHMSEVARKHAGELTVIGVNVRETENARASVEAVTQFVERKGMDMDYIVAMDDPVEKPLFESWMTAAGSYGIPTAFIIGKDGRLAYMGYPTDDRAQYTFDRAVAMALADTNDLAAARSLQKEMSDQTADRLRENELLKPIHDARERKDYEAVVAEADRIIADQPVYASRLFVYKLSAMLHVDEEEALAFASRQARDPAILKWFGAADETEFQGRLAWTIAGEDGLSGDVYRQGLAYAKTANAADPENLSHWITLARLERRLDNVDGAIAAQRQALSLAAEMDIPGDYVVRMEETLTEYLHERAEN